MSNLIRCAVLMLLVAGTSVAKAQIERGTVEPQRATGQTPSSATRLPIQFARKEGAESDPRAPQVARQGALEISTKKVDQNDEEPMPLPPRTHRRRAADEPGKATSPGGMLTTVVGSLAIVLAAFFAFVWCTRRTAPRGSAPLPTEVVESLGRAPLIGRQQMQLIRVGKKLVLLSVTAGEARTLTEVTDPDEVDRLAGLCQQSRPGSITSSFRQVLTQSGQESASRTRPTPRSREESHPSTYRAASRETRHG